VVQNIDYRSRNYGNGSFSAFKSRINRSLLNFIPKDKPFILTEKQAELLKQGVYYYYYKTRETDSYVINNFLKEIENKSVELVASKAKEPEKFMKTLFGIYNCMQQVNYREPLVQFDATASVIQIIGTVTRNLSLMKISNVIHNEHLIDPYKEIYDSFSKDQKISILEEFLKKKNDLDTTKVAVYAKKIYDDIENSVNRK
jgi:hypothetical protein